MFTSQANEFLLQEDGELSGPTRPPSLDKLYSPIIYTISRPNVSSPLNKLHFEKLQA